MKYLQLLGCTALLAIMFSCNETTSGNEHNVTIQFDADTLQFLEVSPRQAEPIDTILLAEGENSFHIAVDTPGFFGLIYGENKTVTFFMQPGESIEIREKGDKLDVIGSKETDEIEEIFDLQQHFMSQMMELQQIAAESPNANLDSLVEVSEKHYTEFRNGMLSFYEQNPSSPANIIALFQNANGKPVFDPYRDEQMYTDLADALDEAYPTLPDHSDFLREMLSNNTLPNISLPDPSGQPVDLASEISGSWSIVAFWAEWCKQCNDEISTWKAIQKAYPEIKIALISLDGIETQNNPEEIWKQAIASNGIGDWIHLSDLKGYQSTVIPLLSIRNMPHSYLINPEGKVKAFNLLSEEWMPYVAEQIK